MGALKGIRIGPRTTIWSEEGMVQKGAFEFEETEQFIATAESLVGLSLYQRAIPSCLE